MASVKERIAELEAENFNVRKDMEDIRETQKALRVEAETKAEELERIYNTRLTRGIEIQGALKVLKEWENAEVVGGEDKKSVPAEIPAGDNTSPEA